jgi:5-formyltetrahydrofolate cyclo-ligase
VPDFAGEAERIEAAKVAMRAQILTARKTLTASACHTAAASVQAVLLPSVRTLSSVRTPSVRTQHPPTVAAYVPMGPEPGGEDLPTVLLDALAPDGRLLLPVLLNDGDLDWAAFTGALTPGRRGLLEPVGTRLGVHAIRTATLVIVPALAVDPAGRRLGRGGGSYDRALSRISTTRTVALLHDGELIAAVPAAPHDRPVHATITPSRGLHLSQAAEWTK